MIRRPIRLIEVRDNAPDVVPREGSLAAWAGDLGSERWFRALVTDRLETFVQERWNALDQSFTWLAEDPTSSRTQIFDRSIDLAGMTHRARVEMLVGIGTDETAGNSASPGLARSIASRAAQLAVGSLAEIDTTSMPRLAGPVLRRWVNRLELAGADPASEWLRDEVRFAVIKPGSLTNSAMRLGEITQPWLRDLATEVLRVRVGSSTQQAVQRWCVAVIVLSRYLNTRTDQGKVPAKLSAATMTSYATTLYGSPDYSDQRVTGLLRDLHSVLNGARELGLLERHGLSWQFQIRPRVHLRTGPVRIDGDRSIPMATLRTLLGTDDLLGERVLRLAESVATSEFHGKLFRSYVCLASQFGRRPEELARLPADRLRTGDEGSAELLYDNFKSGRTHVWLPVDAHAARQTRDWLVVLREHYPNTPLEELALFPARELNRHGTKPIDPATLGAMFRRWLTLLEQAIVIAHLHRTTGRSIEDLILITVGDVRDRSVRVGGVSYPLDPQAADGLVDYVGTCRARAVSSKYCPSDLDVVLLFRDPGSRPLKDEQRGDLWRPTLLSRFEALGPGWLKAAGRYPCVGIPGPDLGERRINADLVQMRLFRHTYLQHLVNLGVDIFIVQELADHANVQTTIDYYVRVNAQRLREAVDLLARHRIGWLGQVEDPHTLPVPSQPTRDMGTNDCDNPAVLDLGNAGCEFDRMCFDCAHYVADPSNMPDMKSEIHTINLTLARLRASPESDLRPHHEAVLLARRDGWQCKLHELQKHLDALPAPERGRVLAAARIVREFRDRSRSGGINLGGTELP